MGCVSTRLLHVIVAAASRTSVALALTCGCLWWCVVVSCCRVLCAMCVDSSFRRSPSSSGHGVSGRSRRSVGGSATRCQIGAVVRCPPSPSPTLSPSPALRPPTLGVVDSTELACGVGVLLAPPARLLLRGAPVGRAMRGGSRCR